MYLAAPLGILLLVIDVRGFWLSRKGRDPLLPRLIAQAGRLSPDARAMYAVTVAVVLANVPYLLDLFDPNPLGPFSGLLSAVTPGVIGGTPTLDPNHGVISQALSHRAMLDWLHLQPPWWNPYEGTGMPLAGEMQSAALFPPTLLTVLANGQLYEHMLLEIVAGISTYLLLRRISINRWASIAAAIAFAVNGTFAWFANAAVNPVAFLPMLLLGIELAYAASVAGRAGGWSLIAVAGALSLYAGFPETAYIDALMATGWFAWRCGCLGRARPRALVGKAAAGAVVAGLLAAPLLIASLDYFNHADLERHSSSYFASVHLPAQALPQLVLPYMYGPIFGDLKLLGVWGTVGGYLSTSLLLLGLLGLFSKGRRGLRLTLLFWIVLALARMYDEPHLLSQALGLLPGMSRIAFYRYAFAPLELSVIILAALGIDDLARAPASQRRMAWCALALLAAVAAVAIGAPPVAHHLGSMFNHRPYYWRSVVWGAGIGIALSVAALVSKTRARVAAVALLVACDALVMFVVPELSAPQSVRTDLAPVAYLQRHLGQSRFMTLEPLQPNYGSYFGIASLNASDGALPVAFARYVRTRLNPVVAPTLFAGNAAAVGLLFTPTTPGALLSNLAAYRAAGVSYVLTSPGYVLPQSAATFGLVLRSPSTRIYHLAGASPYFTATNPRCGLIAESRESVQLACAAPTVLIRRETDLPGWSAQVDGRPVSIRRADDLFQAVNVSAGTHRITFSYLPPNIGWGFLAFAAGCATLLLAFVTGRRRRRRVS